MKADDRQKWIDALRSGKYEQGRGYLRVNDTFCCLGVLCDLVEPDWEPRGDYTDQQLGMLPYRWRGAEVFTLPEWLMSAKGLKAHEVDKLIMLNDAEKPFTEIADWIEQNTPAEPTDADV